MMKMPTVAMVRTKLASSIAAREVSSATESTQPANNPVRISLGSSMAGVWVKEDYLQSSASVNPIRRATSVPGIVLRLERVIAPATSRNSGRLFGEDNILSVFNASPIVDCFQS
jgi:hypothetical protein